MQNKAPTCYIIQGDCMDVLTALPDDFIDLTVTDPAWESIEKHRSVGTTTRLKESKGSSNPWFGKFFPDSFYPYLFRQLLRVHKPDTHAYVFCDDETEDVILNGRRPQEKKLIADPQTWPPAAIGWTAWPSLLYWKIKQGMSDADLAIRIEAALLDLDLFQLKEGKLGKQAHQQMLIARIAEQLSAGGMGWHWRKDTERILFLEKGKRMLNFKGWNGLLMGFQAGRTAYPTQKAETALRRLILNSSQPGDMVLDCFGGSGSVGFAALKEGRNALIIDINTSGMVERDDWPSHANTVWTNTDGIAMMFGKRPSRQEEPRPYDEVRRFILEESRLAKAITHCSRLVTHPGSDNKSRLLLSAHVTADAAARVLGLKVESTLQDNHGLRLLLLADLQQAGYIQCPNQRFDMHDVDLHVIA
jgi:site-specific DNA-methyltransferase (adenine-specific)